MDVQDHTKATIPSGHVSHGVHLCHRCGWPFPNPNPSSRHRRAHKKICGTIEGYTILIHSEVVSDDEPHSDEDTYKTPSPVIEEKGGIKGSSVVRSIRSEEDLYSDAATEFSDTGLGPGVEDQFVDAKKTLDKDVFLSFKDDEDADATQQLDGRVEHSKASPGVVVMETTLDTHAKDEEKTEETKATTVPDPTEVKVKLLQTDEKPSDHVVKDEGVDSTLGQIDGSKPPKAESIDLVQASTESAEAMDANDGQDDTPEVSGRKENGDEAVYVLSVPSEIPVADHSEALLEDFKDHKTMHSNVPATLGSNGDNDAADVKAGENRIQETRNSEIEECSANLESTGPEHTKMNPASIPTSITEEPKVTEDRESEISETTPQSAGDLTEAIDGDNKGEQEKLRKEAVLAAGEKSEAVSAAGNDTEIGHEKLGSDHEHAAEVAKEPEIDPSVWTEKEDFGAHILKSDPKVQTQEIVEEPEIDHSGSVLTTEEDLTTPDTEKCSKEHAQEVVREPEIDPTGSVLTIKEDLGAGNLEKCSNENTQEVVKEPEVDHIGSVLTEKNDLSAPNLEDSSKEHTQEVVKESEIARSVSLLSEKEDLDAPNLKNESKEQTQEVVKEPEIDHSGSVLSKKEDLGASNLEDCPKQDTKEVVKEPEIDNGCKVAVEVVRADSKDSAEVAMHERSSEKVILKEADRSPNDLECTSENSTTMGDNRSRNDDKNASVVSEPIVEEGNDKLMTNQDSGMDMSADSSSHNSLEGTWGSVSVLSTASIDADTLLPVDKSKFNSEKSTAVDIHSSKLDVSDVPSSMETKGEVGEQKAPAASSETKTVQNSQQQPTSGASQTGGSSTLANINNELEGEKKRNQEVIAKVTNWSTGKHSAPLKNLLGEAKSPNPKLSTVIQKDEAAEESNGNTAATEKMVLPSEAPTANQDLSPPKYIGDGKKVKGRKSWMPFVCCSSVNVGK